MEGELADHQHLSARGRQVEVHPAMVVTEDP
jgi:hypothetical protein